MAYDRFSDDDYRTRDDRFDREDAQWRLPR